MQRIYLSIQVSKAIGILVSRVGCSHFLLVIENPTLRGDIKYREQNSNAASQLPLDLGSTVHEAHFGPRLSINFQRKH